MHLHAQVPYLYLFFWETKCLLPSTIQSQSPSSQCNWVILWDDNFVAQKSPFSRWISHYMHKVKEKSLVDLADYFFHLYVTDSSSVIHKRWKEAHGNLCKQPKCQSGLAALHRLQLDLPPGARVSLKAAQVPHTCLPVPTLRDSGRKTGPLLYWEKSVKHMIHASHNASGSLGWC